MASESASRTPQLRKDCANDRWVIFSPARAKRPSDFKSKSPASNPNPNQQCPFCMGHEHECAPEIFRVPETDPNWKIRVIQNLYPALSRDLVPSQPVSDNCPSVLDGFGFHDVVIETPIHSVQLCDLSPPELVEVLMAYRRRIEQIASSDSIKYVQVRLWVQFLIIFLIVSERIGVKFRAWICLSGAFSLQFILC